MKNKARYLYITGAVLTLLVVFLIAVTGHDKEVQAASNQTFNDLHVCSMHPWEASEGPSECEICGMALSRVEGHEHGTTLPPVERLYAREDNPIEIVEVQSGGNPESGLIPITESPFYQPRSNQEMSHEAHDHEPMEMESSEMSNGSATQLYTCGMHPDVIQEGPGTCPICGMNLTPLQDTGSSAGTVRIDPVTLQNIGVVTETALQRDLVRTIRTNGTIVAAEDAEVKVNARVQGWVETLHVGRTGDQVQQDQPLLEIYSPELVSAQQEFLLALDNHELVRAYGNNDEANALLEAARQRLRLWNISGSQISRLEQTRRVRRTLTIQSPADGIVLHKNVVNGSAVQPGMDLFRIVDLDTVWVLAQIYETDLPWIRTGNRVRIESAYNPNVSRMGRIDYIYPTVNPASRTVEARIVLSNPDLQFRTDMYVDVVIDGAERSAAVSIPHSALIRTGQRELVFVRVDEGEFQPREVHSGLETDDYVEIRDGLHDGEEVVISAQFLLDSEARLQEAIQRRIRQNQGRMDDQAAASGSHSGHQH